MLLGLVLFRLSLLYIYFNVELLMLGSLLFKVSISCLVH